MEILTQLGVNKTAFIQFFIFAIAFFTLSSMVFKPYAEALHKREEKTKGGEEVAEQMLKQSADLKTQFETKAREVSGEINSIYETYREQAMKEYSKIVAEARGESQSLVEDTKKRVSVQVADAAVKLKEEIPTVAGLITQRLINK